MRAVRKWLTARISEAAVGCAPRVPEETVDAVETALAWAGPRFPVVSRIVARNMRAVGLYTHQHHREYFRQVARQLTGWLHVFRCAEAAGRGCREAMSPQLARIVAQRVRLDTSVERLAEAALPGRGVVVMVMHVAGLPMWLARMNQAVPTTVFARYSKDARHRRIKRRGWRATGLAYVSEPSRPGTRGGRLTRMAEVLAQGRAVVIAADMVRKRPKGRAVRLFDREVYLPSGAAVLSVMTGAPLMMVSARPAGCANTLMFRGPFAGTVERRGQAGAEAAIAERLQWFADGLEAFLRAAAPLWFFWGDKRWTRVFQGDPDYVRMLEGDAKQAASAGRGQGDS